ncbi:MAG: hypothetical protein K6E91_12825 [Butyrivibrio sp.]|nr:hypothetical protein [Butyrivibrio sp.]
MGFDISKLTSAVNRYLNSISDVSAAAKRVTEEAESKALFGKELQFAIKQNIASHMDDGKMSEAVGELGNFPNIEGQIRSQIDTATSGVKSTFDQINGGLGAMRSAGASDAAVGQGSVNTKETAASQDSAKTRDAVKNAAASKGGTIDVAVGRDDASLATLLAAYGTDSSLLSGILGATGGVNAGLTELLGAAGKGNAGLTGLLGATGGANAGLTELLGATGGVNAGLTGLHGAVGNGNAGNAVRGVNNGTMSIEELQELSKSKYFSTNLLQNDLFSESGGSGKTTSGDDMLSTLTSGMSSSQIASSELANALLKAYKSSGTKGAVTSVFGDFSL